MALKSYRFISKALIYQQGFLLAKGIFWWKTKRDVNIEHSFFFFKKSTFSLFSYFFFQLHCSIVLKCNTFRLSQTLSLPVLSGTFRAQPVLARFTPAKVFHSLIHPKAPRHSGGFTVTWAEHHEGVCRIWDVPLNAGLSPSASRAPVWSHEGFATRAASETSSIINDLYQLGWSPHLSAQSRWHPPSQDRQENKHRMCKSTRIRPLWRKYRAP